MQLHLGLWEGIEQSFILRLDGFGMVHVHWGTKSFGDGL